MYTYFHNNGFITTVGELLSQETGIFFGININEFLSYKDEKNVTNLQNIKNFNNDNKIDYISKKILIPIRNGVKLVIPESKLNKDKLLFYGGLNINYISDSVFRVQKIVDIENDKKYIKTYRQTLQDDQLGTLTSASYSATVLVWCKSLNQNDENIFINISNFVENLTTNSGKNGANFSINLSDFENIDVSDVKNEFDFLISKTNNSLVKQELFGGDAKLSDYTIKLNTTFLNSKISQSDIVFIRFEKLENDKVFSNFIVKSSELKGINFDLIGLVDSCKKKVDENYEDVNISGRDLSKLFIDDGTYFFPIEFAQGFSPINGKSTLRLPNNGEIFYLKYFQYKTIPEVLLFVLNYLTSINICNENLFSDFDYVQSIKDIEKEKILHDINQKTVDLRQRIKVKISVIRKLRALFVLNAKIENTEIQSTFLNIKDLFIYANKKGFLDNKKILSGFTYNGFIINTESAHYNAFRGIFKNTSKIIKYEQSDFELFSMFIELINYEESIKSINNQLGYLKSSHIWRLIELVIDDSIKDRILVDSSISVQSGSILGFISKICQEPFVETILDTYGDKYYITVRTPPFTKKQILNYIDLKKIKTQYGDAYFNSTIFINANDVQSLDLEYNEDNIYTWFQLLPKNLYFGNNYDFITSYLPAKGFKEFIDIWGSKPMQITTNYVPNLKNNKDVEKQLLLDLIYIIESNIYLPFTKKGTITITGDRRIKKGSFIELTYTGEIFYVDTVTNSYNALGTRTTTLSVSRGMYKKYISGVEVDGEIMSYFNIVKIDEIKESIVKKIEKQSKTKQTQVKQNVEVLIKPDYAYNISNYGLDFLKAKEQLRHRRYTNGEKLKTLDSLKTLYTIGYGHLIKQNEEIKYSESYYMSSEEAEIVLKNDLKIAIKTVNNIFSNMYQWEFDMLVSVVFNTSNSSSGFIKKFPTFVSLVKSYLTDRTEINKNKIKKYWSTFAISAQNSGTVLFGLKTRREEESSVFIGNFSGSQYKSAQPDKKIILDQVANTVTEEFLDVVVEETQLNVSEIIQNMSVNKKVFNYFLTNRNE